MLRQTARTLGLLMALGLALVAGSAAAAPTPAGALDPVIDGYMAVHAGLFDDDLAGTQAAAKALATTAKGHDDLVAAATAIAGAKDLEAARLAFGDASRALITLVVADPAAAAAVHAFKCPMAKGYQKWIQRVDKLANPYMGQRMPKCGTHTDLAP
ncbi:MAG: DUF3347 domain-containing protein [Deltaproteobacteria bacterium]|nr:MAG: DUF3347 domain-containing protein [Deltaproteobacteria bacterium]